MKTEPAELVFKGTAEPHVPFQMLVGTDRVFRSEEFVVKTPDDFTIGSLFIGAMRLIGDVPAIAFSEDARPEARQVHPVMTYPYPATDIVLSIVNESDEPREFEAVLKGKAMTK